MKDTLDMTASRFRVTAKAGPRVAGRRVQVGDELTGTVAQYQHELDMGQLVKVRDDVAPALSVADAPAEPAGDAPAPVAVASVPFMITRAQREVLKSLGKSPEDIANMTPAEALALIPPAHG